MSQIKSRTTTLEEPPRPTYAWASLAIFIALVIAGIGAVAYYNS